jgi:hypothetical protein
MEVEHGAAVRGYEDRAERLEKELKETTSKLRQL